MAEAVEFKSKTAADDAWLQPALCYLAARVRASVAGATAPIVLDLGHGGSSSSVPWGGGSAAPGLLVGLDECEARLQRAKSAYESASAATTRPWSYVQVCTASAEQTLTCGGAVLAEIATSGGDAGASVQGADAVLVSRPLQLMFHDWRRLLREWRSWLAPGRTGMLAWVARDLSIEQMDALATAAGLQVDECMLLGEWLLGQREASSSGAAPLLLPTAAQLDEANRMQLVVCLAL